MRRPVIRWIPPGTRISKSPSARPAVLLRPVTVEDADRIAAIYAPVVRDSAASFEIDPPDAVEMARRIGRVTAGHPWLVAEDEGTILGYSYASAYRERPAYRWSVETTVYVAASHRGRGLGRSVYSALIDEATRWGFATAFAGIAIPNPASESLHRAVGFEPIGVFVRAGFKAGEWRDVSWWQRPLSNATPPVVPTRPL